MTKNRHYMSIPIKKQCVSSMMRDAIRKWPTITRLQLKRIFCYGYFTLSNEGFDKEFRRQKRIVNNE